MEYMTVGNFNYDDAVRVQLFPVFDDYRPAIMSALTQILSERYQGGLPPGPRVPIVENSKRVWIEPDVPLVDVAEVGGIYELRVIGECVGRISIEATRRDVWLVFAPIVGEPKGKSWVMDFGPLRTMVY